MPILLNGCTQQIVSLTDRDVARLIERKQRETLALPSDASLPVGDATRPPGRSAYDHDPSSVAQDVVPPGFDTPTDPTPPPPPDAPEPGVGADQDSADGEPTSMPATGQAAERFRDQVFTLADALAYAQINKRDFQAAKEDLYLSALALTLERHLWTPIFAADLRSVYGNYGQIADFDQAMRFVADLRMSQRLPYGGEFTAQMISTLIRDVKKSLTATENGQIVLGVNLPFLRNAGHVAREDLIQLERSLVYAVRDFERFRRRQLVDVMGAYFDLLTTKQQVRDAEQSYGNSVYDFRRAEAVQESGMGTLIDTGRAELAMLGSESRLAVTREDFRAAADRFKLLIGMPVDEPIGLDDLENISDLEEQVEAGLLPLLRRPAAVDDEALGLDVALERRLDLLNRRDQIDDARRGVNIAENQLLPDFGLNSSVTYATDEDHFRMGGYTLRRATWRSELLLSLPLERTAERNRLRAAIIDVHAAQRTQQETQDTVRVDVRSAINRILLTERTVMIQERSVDVAAMRREFASIEYEEGRISNRDKIEAEQEWNDARNQLNRDKAARWRATLDFRLATDTLLIDDEGGQIDPGP